MNSKEALKKINQYWADINVIGKSDIVISNEDWEEVYKDLEILDILKKKGVAVGFIQLQIKENCGGVREYNDYIGKDKSLHLTADEYKKLKEWYENDK